MDIIGHYKEFWSKSTAPTEWSISHFISKAPEGDANEIGRYLRSGHEIVSTMGAETDIIDRSTTIIGAASILSDGISIWREDLIHYFNTYNLRLPAEFLARVRKSDYKMPEMTQKLGLEVTKEVNVLLRASKG